MKRALLACLILPLSPLFLRAQIANNTSLVGTVSDASGGVISGSKVTAVEENTKVQSEAVTNAAGYYSITFIQPGHTTSRPSSPDSRRSPRRVSSSL